MKLFQTRGLMVMLVALMGSVPALPADDSPASRLGSKVFKWEELVAKPTAVGVRRDVVNLPTATLERFECHISTLNAGLMSHPPHRHPQEEFIILKEGVLEVFVNGRTQRVGPGSFFFFASNDLHNVTNVGDQPATYLVFNLTTTTTRDAPPDGAAAANLPGKLGSTVLDWAALPVKATKTGERRELVNSPTCTCANLEGHVTTLRTGEVPHAPHHHPDEELVIVKEGQMEVTINGVSTRAGPGSIVFYASNDQHGMKNVGTTMASYHVIRFVTAATPAAGN
jgi:quercetin dioxygenase-like cupin family protein